MRGTASFAFLLLTAACGDRVDSGDGDSDNGPTVTRTLEAGTTSYSVMVDGTTVCNSTYAMTGEEYEGSICDNCDYMFQVETVETSNTDTLGCTDRDPWAFTLMVPYPAYQPLARSGIGYSYPDGQTDLFFSFSSYEIDGTWALQPLSGAFLPGTPQEATAPGTYTNTDGEIAWTYEPPTRFDPLWAYTRNCSDRASAAEGDLLSNVVRVERNRYNQPTGKGEDETYDDWVDYVGVSVMDSLQGSVSCTPNEYVDTYSVDVPLGNTLSVSVDVLDTSHQFDPLVWINDGQGCTVTRANDQFQCTVQECDDPRDGIGGQFPGIYSCCPSAQVQNTSGAAQTYAILVMANNALVCTDPGHVGAYTIKVAGGTALTLVGDDLRPSYQVVASGTATITTVTTP